MIAAPPDVASATARPMAEDGLAPASLYSGTVMHARMKPKAHRFSYRVFNLFIDIDRLDEAARLSPLFSIGRFNLLGFNPLDHVAQPTLSLRQHVDDLLKPVGLGERPGRVMLLCYPRILGFVFNPISVYFCHAPDGTLEAVIYEVRNTFRERHTYVAPVLAGEISAAGLRQERDKRFYVSPFLPMPLRYRFRLRVPAESCALRILETDAEGPILAATFSGVRQALTSLNILKLCSRYPLMTLKVVAGINWEALKLWRKGLTIQTRPPPPPAASYGDVGTGLVAQVLKSEIRGAKALHPKA
jgi:hypothetical protein